MHRHERAPFFWALALTLSFALIEWVGGVLTGSLALIADAGHMFSDSMALALAALAAWIARRPRSLRHSYGFARAEVIVAAVNGVLMLAVIVMIVIEAIERLRAPVPVAGGGVVLIAGIGLIINAIVATMISRGEKTLNTRAALIHVIGDLLGSVAALLAGAVIFFTGWLPIDPILSLAIAALILFSTLNLLKSALHVLMEGVPTTIDLAEVGRELALLEGVNSVHDLHVWTISSGQVALSAHIELEEMVAWPRILGSAKTTLREQFAIDHVTLQPEIALKQPYEPKVRIVPLGRGQGAEVRGQKNQD
ncbi:MAG: cation diffusion facilitator family transporter [Burkholderiales bacterium]